MSPTLSIHGLRVMEKMMEFSVEGWIHDKWFICYYGSLVGYSWDLCLFPHKLVHILGCLHFVDQLSGNLKDKTFPKGPDCKICIYLQFISYTGNGNPSQAHGTVILTILDCNFEYSNSMRMIFFIGNECLKPFTILKWQIVPFSPTAHWASMCKKSGQWWFFLGHPRSSHCPVTLDKNPYGIFLLTFGLLQKIRFVTNKSLWFLHVLFIMIHKWSPKCNEQK